MTDIETDVGGEGVPLLAPDADPPDPEPTLPKVPVDPPDPAELEAKRARSNRTIKYACTVCGREVGRANLKVKRVQYREMGVGGRIEKSRVVAWLCITPNGKKPSCLEADMDFKLPSLSAAPGMADTRLASGGG